MSRRARRNHAVLFAGLLLALLTVLLSPLASAQDDQTPRWDIFVGYQYLAPGITVAAPGSSSINPTPFKLPDLKPGVGGAVGYNFTRYWALEGDLGTNWNDQGRVSTISFGPRFTLRSEDQHVNLFAHALISDNRLNVVGLDSSNGIGAVLGGGLDIIINRRISYRLIGADYVWAHHNFANDVGVQSPSLRRPTMQGGRLRMGIVFNFGYPETAQPTANCSVQPAEVMVGEPIAATATANGFNPKHTLSYSWNANGGKVTGKDNTASIDTNGMSGGSYTVTAHVNDPKKKGAEVSCSANFTVKEPPKNPPTVSLSASPASVQTGGSVNVSASCTSPDGVPVTVSGWTATGGTVSGNGNSATLNTTGASAGPVTVSATCADSRGLSNSASTQVAVENPPPPTVSPEVKRLEARLALHSVYFPTAQPTEKNPKGGLLTSQQKTLVELASDFQKYLQSKPDAHLILEGHADPRGSVPYNQALSERRVDRTKGFLIENGVPAANIDTKALGDQHNLTADQVKQSVDQNPELTTEERQRVLRNMRTIILASNRRVDVTLSTTGQESVRQYPFNATDSLSLIGGRQSQAKKPARTGAKKPVKKK